MRTHRFITENFRIDAQTLCVTSGASALGKRYDLTDCERAAFVVTAGRPASLTTAAEFSGSTAAVKLYMSSRTTGTYTSIIGTSIGTPVGGATTVSNMKAAIIKISTDADHGETLTIAAGTHSTVYTLSTSVTAASLPVTFGASTGASVANMLETMSSALSCCISYTQGTVLFATTISTCEVFIGLKSDTISSTKLITITSTEATNFSIIPAGGEQAVLEINADDLSVHGKPFVGVGIGTAATSQSYNVVCIREPKFKHAWTSTEYSGSIIKSS